MRHLPASSPDFGKNISAYYYWLFPNMMLNFYPWGLSLNLVQPLGLARTRVLRFNRWQLGAALAGLIGLNAVKRICDGASDDEKDAIFWRNASRFYALSAASLGLSEGTRT